MLYISLAVSHVTLVRADRSLWRGLWSVDAAPPAALVESLAQRSMLAEVWCGHRLFG